MTNSIQDQKNQGLSTSDEQTTTLTEGKAAQANGSSSAPSDRPSVLVRPRFETWEADGAVMVSLDVPGADEENIDIAVERGVLQVRATVVRSIPEGYRSMAGFFGRRVYERHFRLDETIDTSAIEATVKNGVLTLRLPRAERFRPAKIAVKRG